MVYVRGLIELKRGYFNGSVWNEERAFDFPLDSELNGSTLVVKLCANKALGGGGPSRILVEKTYSDSIRFPFAYEIEIPFEEVQNVKENREQMTVSAVLNVGWSRDEKHWIRQGDWHNDTTFRVDENLESVKSDDVFEMNFHMVHYPLQKPRE
uniref:Uncharacterized protein n=1 Tax=Timspurckia oligopyrenoides TaxID=708627 RepID=A0A7S0ZCY5_9RHOD|mmetsp:Transcript_1284/g.2365  ORF Transcript_1284/g.2365 Transcript_1284/m.2365 type:complete len:153 (+) Transcript_1284:15-473(+)